MRILVTGAAGYIAGRLAHALAALECELLLATRYPTKVGAVPPNATVRAFDWADNDDLDRICDGQQVVVHLAGMNARECALDPIAALRFNAVDTARLVRAAAGRGVKRFIYLSTAHVYGSALREHVDELSATAPLSPYASSHRAGEDATRITARERGMERLVMRLSNAFGAPRSQAASCWSLVANDLCRQAVLTRRAVLRSRGDQRRDFVPMSEACRAIVHLLSMPTPLIGDGLFNAGGRWAPTILELAQLIGERVEAVLGFMPQVVTGAQQEPHATGNLTYSVEKLMSTGFVPQQGAVTEELDRLIDFCAQEAR